MGRFDDGVGFGGGGGGSSKDARQRRSRHRGMRVEAQRRDDLGSTGCCDVDQVGVEEAVMARVTPNLV